MMLQPYRIRAREIGEPDIPAFGALLANGFPVRSNKFWSGALKFEADGKARLPFWDRTLVLTRAAGAVTANFEPRADGRGWQDLPGETAKPH